MDENDKDLKKFLRDLSRLTRTSGIIIAGCGCCGSPFVFGEAFDGSPILKDGLAWDTEKQKYGFGFEGEKP